jgi:RNA polymerase sigma-70 factor (ECF subfamily)
LGSALPSHVDVFQEYRPLLFSIAYRMLGSADEADDVLQDAYMRFQPEPLAALRSPKAFLSTIVTRLCLNQLKSARARREQYLGPWLPEPIFSEEIGQLVDPEKRLTDYDSISIAFLSLLQTLTPAERAVFLLHEVFEYRYDEVAGMLDKSEVACRKLFSRAKRYLAKNRPRFTTTPAEHRRILEQFMRASGSGDLNNLTAMLTQDVVFWADGGGKVRGAALQPVRSRDAVGRFILGVSERFTPPGATFAIADINGRPTILVRNSDGSPAIVLSVELDEGRIQSIWAIANPDKLTRVRNGSN